jgi:PAS domain S-box-containing protein
MNPPLGARSSRELMTPREAPRVWWITLAVVLVMLAVAGLVDRWHSGLRVAQAHASVRARGEFYANALRGAVERRIALLSGLRSFAGSQRSRAALDELFPLFAQGTLTGTNGVRALQFVEDGRIVATWPLKGNEAALGYDLAADPRPLVRNDVARALASGRVTVTGPLALVQGGSGLLVRQRIEPRDGLPDLAAIILDVPALLAEAGVPNVRSGLRLSVLDRSGMMFGGDSLPPGVVAETLVVAVPDGDWRLLVAPAAGWDALVSSARWTFRVGAGAIVLASGLLSLVLFGRTARLEREVEATGSQLDLALRAGRMGVWEWDIPSQRALWNAAATELFGFDCADFEQPIHELLARVHPDDEPMVRQVMRESVRGERFDHVMEYRIARWPDQYRWLLSIGETTRDAEGRPLLVIGVISDATQRRQMEDRLRHSQKLESVGKLAGGVAHDFNNLLTAIIGFGELARDRAGELPSGPQRSAIRDDLQELLQVAHKGAEVTGQLLAFSRRGPSEATRVELSAAVRETVPLLQRLMGATVTILTELADELPAVWIDAAQLTQIVMNLVINARDAMLAGGAITVRTSHVPAGSGKRPIDAPHGEWVCLEVEDAGVGMAPEVQARIFEPYYTTKEPGRGTGLGLAVVYGAVETARGVVTVRSFEGIGTSFRVYLPPYREAAR